MCFNMKRRLLSTATKVFDWSLKTRQREWAISVQNNEDYDYLRKEVATRLVDKLDDIVRDFPAALDVGCHKGFIYDALVEKNEFVVAGDRPIGAITHLTQADSKGFHDVVETKLMHSNNSSLKSCFHEMKDENDLELKNEDKFDIVMSSMWLHWVNDIPRFFKSIREILRPDGAFICSVPGGSTLEEFRHSFYLAELERKGGVAPHVSPLLRPSDAAALLQQANFALPTIDVDTITVNYGSAALLMEHLVAMGEGSAAYNRQFNVGRESLLAMAAIYQELYGEEDGSIPVTYQIISMIGWNPHHSQPKPLRRGTATKSMKDLAEPTEIDMIN